MTKLLVATTWGICRWGSRDILDHLSTIEEGQCAIRGSDGGVNIYRAIFVGGIVGIRVVAPSTMATTLVSDRTCN